MQEALALAVGPVLGDFSCNTSFNLCINPVSHVLLSDTGSCSVSFTKATHPCEEAPHTDAQTNVERLMTFAGRWGEDVCCGGFCSYYF